VIIQVLHETSYVYSDPVFIEPQHFYFHPAFRDHIKVLEFSLKVDPNPEGMVGRLDAESNYYYQCWFNNLISSMNVELKMKVEVTNFNPFDFLIESDESANPVLAPYLDEENIHTGGMESWFSSLVGDLSANDKLGIISELNSVIHDNWDHQARIEHGLLSPQVCFEKKSGSCRDLAWMMIHFCRSIGIPSRFVSGYAYNPELVIGHELHAWVECYLPGGGWVGVDPSAGLFVNDHYIPICTSFHPKNTLPIQGGYRGNATSSLEFSVDILAE
jgi:hypothetical protein